MRSPPRSSATWIDAAMMFSTLRVWPINACSTDVAFTGAGTNPPTAMLAEVPGTQPYFLNTLLAGFGPFVRLRLLPPCWNCGTREFLWLSATKSICDSEGILNENFVIPSKLVTAKSPPAMMSMPIKISAPGKLPLVTRTPLAPTELGRIMLTRYVSDSPCPSTE